MNTNNFKPLTLLVLMACMVLCAAHLSPAIADSQQAREPVSRFESKLRELLADHKLDGANQLSAKQSQLLKEANYLLQDELQLNKSERKLLAMTGLSRPDAHQRQALGAMVLQHLENDRKLEKLAKRIASETAAGEKLTAQAA